MEKRSSKGQGRLAFACAIVAAMMCMTAGAQEVVAVKASASASHSDRLQKIREDGFTSYEVVGRDTYSASATFTLDATPADWTALIQSITVSVGGIDCSPEIVKGTAKGGSARLSEKDKETKSALLCSAKWSKNTITFSLSGSNYDGDTILDGSGDDGAIAEDIEVSVDLGEIAYSMSVPLKGKWKTVIKTVKDGKGEDAFVDEYELVTWSAKGSTRTRL